MPRPHPHHERPTGARRKQERWDRLQPRRHHFRFHHYRQAGGLDVLTIRSPLPGWNSINLNPYVIGVPPLSFQWRWNGTAIPGATNMSYSIPTVTLGVGGAYDLVASNAYGMATSKVSTVTVDQLTQVAASNIVFDSNPFSVQHNGVNMGAIPGSLLSRTAPPPATA